MVKLVAIITAYNRADFVGRCVASVLAAATGRLEIDVIVMDNGSTDDTAEVAAGFGPQVRVLSTPDNRPIVGVINRGFAAAYENPDADYIVLMNEDTEFTPGSLERLIAACDAHPNSLLTPLQLNYRAPEHLDTAAYRHLREVRDLVEDAVLGRPLRDVYSIPTIIGAAIFGKREVWKNIGEFDELFWFYGVDDDMCKRARWLGFEVLLVPSAHLLHAHSKLAASVAVPAPGARLRKWRLETQARYIFLLKNPDRPLWRCVLSTIGNAFRTSYTCATAPWPRGVIESLTIALQCLGRLRCVRAARRRHFDPARRVQRAEPSSK